MAAVSAQSRRRKPATYGKTSRSANTWNITNLEAMDEDELAMAGPTVARSASVKDSYPVQKRETKPALPKPKLVKRREIKQDVWDVPSSESSEDEPSPLKAQPPPKFGGKGTSKRFKETVKLAPWEQAKAMVLDPVQPGEPPNRGVKKDRELRADRAHDVPLSSPSSTARNGVREKAASVSPLPSSPNTSSAAARLQARRLQAGQSKQTQIQPTSQTQKRPVHDNSRAAHTSRKRLRSDKLDDDDVLMVDMTAPDCNTSQNKEAEEDLQEIVNPSAESKASPSVARAKQRRGKLTTYSSPRKMESAPARLSEMLPTDNDTTDDTRSPSVTTSRPATPQKADIASHPSSPRTAFKTSANMSVRQSQLWNRLLPDNAAVSSPSVLPMDALNIHGTGRRSSRTTAAARMLVKSSSDVGHRPTRLVDRLKASMLSSDDESSEAEEEDTDSSDLEMSDANNQQSQSQSQTVAADSGPRFTYAAPQRTWLREESFEDELMLDMRTESSQFPTASPRRAVENSTSTSQKSTFDLDDSDEDEGAGSRLRTIHELRAGGASKRFVDDISSLLEDAANHSSSARSRRRSALIEIATKLADKTFTARFYQQGFEQQLLAESAAMPDDIADFALATAIAALLSAEAPEHAPLSFKNGGAVSLLSRLLTSRTDPRKLAKERRNNMSKAAQASFSDFVANIRRQQGLWEDLKPDFITSRTIALKALDLLVHRLRRSGDRSELLSSNDIAEVLSTQAEIDGIRDGVVPIDVTLSITALESLVTNTLSLAWPTELIERLRILLLATTADNPEAQHAHFLGLRLCLNLTNGNARNCRAFARPDTVTALLKSIAEGFGKLFAKQEDQQGINSDHLVLSMGIMINLTEQKCSAGEHAAAEDAAPYLATLVGICQKGQQRALEAESVEDGVTAVTFGYLAVVLANLCRNREARQIVASRLPGKNLNTLVEAVQEFVATHQKVDTLNFEGEEGIEVWSAFTEKLKGVLLRLRAEAEADEIDRRGRG